MSTLLKAACVQMTSGPDIQENLDAAAALVREAAAAGAQLVATPENTCHIRVPHSEKLKSSLPEDEHPALPLFSDLAKELGIWLLLGSISLRHESGKVSNSAYIFSDQGKVAARYDKIHLFDAELSAQESYRESAVVNPGERAIVAGTPWGGLGMSICYDLRFAHLYRAMVKKGAKILAVPAAFTVPTGQAHWEVLLRARAIETGSFVLAPGQVGEHEGGRRTYGHSMIIGPWGEVLAAMDTETGFVTAELDMEEVDRVRKILPVLYHDREFEVSA